MYTKKNRILICETKLLMFVFMLIVTLSCAQEQDESPIDFHAHIFSPAMLSNFESMGMNLQDWGCINAGCQRIDTIQSRNTERMFLISAGYIYQDSSATKELALVQAENDYLYEALASQPKKLVGFAGINPLRPYALEEVKRCFEELNIPGVKLHFQNNNIDISDPTTRKKIQPIFDYISNNDIPVLIHNNALDKDAGSKLAEAYITHYLTEMPLTIIYAHLGGGAHFTKFNQDFIGTFTRLSNEKKLMGKAYFDISAIVFEREHPEILPINLQKDLLKKIGFEQLLFGSDYPISNVKEYKALITKKWKLSESELAQLLNKQSLFNEFLNKR